MKARRSTADESTASSPVAEGSALSRGDGNASGQERLKVPPGFDPAVRAQGLRDAMAGWGTDERAILDQLSTGSAFLSGEVAQAYLLRFGEPLESALRSELSGDVLEEALHLLTQGKLSLSDELRAATDGMGTDETRIFDALARATPEERANVQNDPALRERLRSELGDSDRLLAESWLQGSDVLRASVRRAVAGVGTDEEALFQALAESSPAERALLTQDTATLAEVEGDLGTADWMRFQGMLDGSFTAEERIRIAAQGWGTDEAALEEAVGMLTLADLQALDVEAILADELSGRLLAGAQETLHQRRLELDATYRQVWAARTKEQLGADAMANEGNSVLLAQEGNKGSAVGRILTACAGGGTDEKEIWEVVSGLDPSERAFILRHNPMGVLDALAGDLSVSEHARVMAVLGGDTLALFEQAADGWGTDEQLVYRTLDRIVRDGGAPDELPQVLTGDLSVEQAAVVSTVLRTRSFSPLDRLRLATVGAGTSEALVMEVCEKFGAELRDGKGVRPEVDAILEDELSTRDYWQATELIRGEPSSEAERLARSKERLERERSGVMAPTLDLFSGAGDRADRSWREYQASFLTAASDQELSAEEEALLRRDEAHADDALQAYVRTRDTVSLVAAQIAVSVIGVAATVLTVGAAGPLVASISAALGGKLAVMAEAMILAAAARVGAQKALGGEGYDLDSVEAFLDGVGAALDVALMAAGSAIAAKAASGFAGTSLAETVVGSLEGSLGKTTTRILASGAQGGLDGVIGGTGEGAFMAARQEKFWVGETDEAITSLGSMVLLRGAVGGGAGFASSAGFHGIIETFGKKASLGGAVHGNQGGAPDGPGELVQASTRPKQPSDLPDVLDTHKGAPWRDVTDGKAFIKGADDAQAVDPRDVSQGSIGDCYFMAACAATARAKPDAIKKLIQDNGDGTFEVTLFSRKSWGGNLEPSTKTVDSRLPMHTQDLDDPLYAGFGNVTPEGKELWPALLEKRWAMEGGSFRKIEGDVVNQWSHAGSALDTVTGNQATTYTTRTMNPDDILRKMEVALDEGRPVTTVTIDKPSGDGAEAVIRQANDQNVYFWHAYAVERVDLAKRTVDLQNPWGKSHVKNLPIEQYMKYYRRLDIGTVRG